MKLHKILQTISTLESLATLGKYAGFGFGCASVIMDTISEFIPALTIHPIWLKMTASIVLTGVGAYHVIDNESKKMLKDLQKQKRYQKRDMHLHKLELHTQSLCQKVGDLKKHVRDPKVDITKELSEIKNSTTLMLSSLTASRLMNSPIPPLPNQSESKEDFSYKPIALISNTPFQLDEELEGGHYPGYGIS